MTIIEPPTVDEPKRSAEASGPRRAKRAPIAGRKAREVLRKADPVLARLIDARPNFRPRAWLDELPPLDAFGTLIFQVAGQQLSVSATRTIVSRIEQHFGGHLPSPAELLAADPQVLRDSGMSTRKGATLRALAERFVDGRLSDDALARMSDAEVEAALTEVQGIGPGRRADSCSLASIGPTCSSPVIWHCGALSAARMGSTIRQPTRRWPNSRIAGGRTAALR